MNRPRYCQRCEGLGRLTAHAVPCLRCQGSGEEPRYPSPEKM